MTASPPPIRRRMILCGGLQSGGTTLVSWTFLQRRDTNGVLDMPNSIIHASFDRVSEPIVWVKMTIGAFRWLDVYDTYRDLGWDPEPLLVVRDVRYAFCSLMRKDYGINGLTAEDPPLRLRMRRALMDWELFRRNDWPILAFEEFVREPRRVLARTCEKLRIPFDEGMLEWSKRRSDITYDLTEGNKTFANTSSAARSLEEGLSAERKTLSLEKLPASELQWLEETFREYNAFHGYPLSVEAPKTSAPAVMGSPTYEATLRHWYDQERRRLYAENQQLRDALAQVRQADARAS
jgi:hypothetical protein